MLYDNDDDDDDYHDGSSGGFSNGHRNEDDKVIGRFSLSPVIQADLSGNSSSI